MALNIKDYIMNLIAGKDIIGSLYDAVIQARRICSLGGNYSYTFSLEGIGKKRYTACQLINFDESYKCISLEEIGNDLSLDNMVIILLKGRTEFRNLFGSYYRDLDAITYAKRLCYTFTNPYGNFLDLNKTKIQFSTGEIVELFRESEDILFDPSLIYF